MGTKISLDITKDQALVLFELLHRLNQGSPVLNFEDQAEQRVLWDLEALLEENLIEPFNANYLDNLCKARERVRDKN